MATYKINTQKLETFIRVHNNILDKNERNDLIYNGYKKVNNQKLIEFLRLL